MTSNIQVNTIDVKYNTFIIYVSINILEKVVKYNPYPHGWSPHPCNIFHILTAAKYVVLLLSYFLPSCFDLWSGFITRAYKFVDVLFYCFSVVHLNLWVLCFYCFAHCPFKFTSFFSRAYLNFSQITWAYIINILSHGFLVCMDYIHSSKRFSHSVAPLLRSRNFWLVNIIHTHSETV